jgi:hypothetical protein
MRIGIAGIVVGRATNAPWIQDQRDVRQLDRALLVTVPTQNHMSLNVSQSYLDRDVLEQADAPTHLLMRY